MNKIYNLKTWEFLNEEYPNQYINEIWISMLYITKENYCDTLSLEDCLQYEKEIWATREMKEARELYFLIMNYNISKDSFIYFKDILETNYIK